MDWRRWGLRGFTTNVPTVFGTFADLIDKMTASICIQQVIVVHGNGWRTMLNFG